MAVSWPQAEQEQQASSSALQGHTAGRARAAAGRPGEFHFDSHSTCSVFLGGAFSSVKKRKRKRFSLLGRSCSSKEETLLRGSASFFWVDHFLQWEKCFREETQTEAFLPSRWTLFFEGRNASSW